MKISYRGLERELAPKSREKLEAKFAKISKLLERRGEKEAHVILTNERHLHHAEITVQFYDHQLVGIGSDADEFTAIAVAIDRLEKQAIKQRAKWREKRRVGSGEEEESGEISDAAPVETPSRARVFRVNHLEDRKPMTLDEALLEMETGIDYLVYRNADRDGVSVLIRRSDGNFDLVES